MFGRCISGGQSPRNEALAARRARPGIVVVALLLSPLALARRAPYVAGLYVAGALLVLAGLWVLFNRDSQWRRHRRQHAVRAAALRRADRGRRNPFGTTGERASADDAVRVDGLRCRRLLRHRPGASGHCRSSAWHFRTGSRARVGAHGRASKRQTNSPARTSGIRPSVSPSPPALRSFSSQTIAPSCQRCSARTMPRPARRCSTRSLATLFAAWAGPNEAMLRATWPVAFDLRVPGSSRQRAGTASALVLIPRYGLTGARPARSRWRSLS